MATITSPLTVTPVHPAFAAEVSGRDLTRPSTPLPSNVSRARSTTTRCWSSTDRPLSDAQQMVFSERWGQLRDHRAHLGGRGTAWAPTSWTSPTPMRTAS